MKRDEGTRTNKETRPSLKMEVRRSARIFHAKAAKGPKPEKRVKPFH